MYCTPQPLILLCDQLFRFRQSLRHRLLVLPVLDRYVGHVDSYSGGDLWHEFCHSLHHPIHPGILRTLNCPHLHYQGVLGTVQCKYIFHSHKVRSGLCVQIHMFYQECTNIWLMIGWQWSCKPIKSHVWKSLILLLFAGILSWYFAPKWVGVRGLHCDLASRLGWHIFQKRNCPNSG